jgi:hypothetical protein
MFYIANTKCKKCIKRHNEFKSTINKSYITKFIKSKKFKIIIKSYLKCLKKYCLIKYINLINKLNIIKKNINIYNPLFNFVNNII